MIALEQDKELAQNKPRVRARGHLALLDWERPAEKESIRAASIRHGDPARRSPFDRLLEHGLALLLLTTIGAVCACLAHL